MLSEKIKIEHSQSFHISTTPLCHQVQSLVQKTEKQIHPHTYNIIQQTRPSNSRLHPKDGEENAFPQLQSNQQTRPRNP